MNPFDYRLENGSRGQERCSEQSCSEFNRFCSKTNMHTTTLMKQLILVYTCLKNLYNLTCIVVKTGVLGQKAGRSRARWRRTLQQSTNNLQQVRWFPCTD